MKKQDIKYHSDKYYELINDLKIKTTVIIGKDIYYNASALWFYLGIKQSYPLWISQELKYKKEYEDYWIVNNDDNKWTKGLLLSEQALQTISLRCNTEIREHAVKCIPSGSFSQFMRLKPINNQYPEGYDYGDLPELPF